MRLMTEDQPKKTHYGIDSQPLVLEKLFLFGSRLQCGAESTPAGLFGRRVSW